MQDKIPALDSQWKIW